MRLDPFRIQIWTVSLDSQMVLAIVGLIVAGWLVQKAARQERLTFGAGDWWDVVLYAIVGGRLLWVVAHPSYYLRQPTQIVVLLDGGLSTVGLALGTAYWIWRRCRAAGAVSNSSTPSWRDLVDVLAVGVLAAFLFERAGCALTTCGSGPATDVPWAMLRGADSLMPLALGQTAVLALALAISTSRLRRRGAAFTAALAALTLVTLIEYLAGRSVAEQVAVLAALAVLSSVSPRAAPAAPRRDAPAAPQPEQPVTPATPQPAAPATSQSEQP